MFQPCGYSVNGLLNGTYLTMHFTPEPTHSFVSFDTNCVAIAPRTALAWLGHVLRPGRMAIAVACDSTAACSPAARRRATAKAAVDNYKRTASTHCEIFSPVTDEPTFAVGYDQLQRFLPAHAAVS
jgi:hypothetical protein